MAGQFMMSSPKLMLIKKLKVQIMKKKLNDAGQAGTTAEQRTKDDGLTSSPAIANALVVGSPFLSKCRAWHKEKKKMIYWDEIQNWNFLVSEDERFVFMRQLGIYLNGEMIYEGDILSAKRMVYGIVDNNGKVHEVFGGDDSQKLFCEWDEIIVAKLNISDDKISFSLPKEGGTYQERGKELNWVKIGNVFENSELLEGVQ